MPLAFDMFIHGAIESLRNQFYEDCKMFEASLHEVVDDGCTRLHDETNECITEIEDTVREQIGEFEDQSDKLNTFEVQANGR